MFGRKHTITLVVQPGSGSDVVDVDPTMSLQDFVQLKGLMAHNITVDGSQVNPGQYASISMGTVGTLWAAVPVKGA
jgi:hypothetical protein